jgi:hypothetical protein
MKQRKPQARLVDARFSTPNPTFGSRRNEKLSRLSWQQRQGGSTAVTRLVCYFGGGSRQSEPASLAKLAGAATRLGSRAATAGKGGHLRWCIVTGNLT